METIELQIQERTLKGGGNGRRLRNQGKVPAVVYGYGSENLLAVIEERDYKKYLAGQSAAQLFRFKSDLSALNGRLALVKEVQSEPLKARPTHVDFFTINENALIEVEVGLEFVGESPAVKAGDGILNISAHEMSIECLPHAIPGALKVDISALLLGDSIHAQDVPLPAGVKLKSDGELTVVSIVAKREEVAEAPVAEAPVATPAATAEKK